MPASLRRSRFVGGPEASLGMCRRDLADDCLHHTPHSALVKIRAQHRLHASNVLPSQLGWHSKPSRDVRRVIVKRIAEALT